MSVPSPSQWWDWDKLKALVKWLRDETEKRLRRERERGVEWVERWRHYVDFDKLDPRTQLFAVLAGTILDYGVSSECVPLYVQKLREAGLLDPEEISKAGVDEVKATLQRCRRCVTNKFGKDSEPVRCRPAYRWWYEKSAEWLISLGKKFNEIVKEFIRVIEDTKNEKGEYRLTPSHIYLVLRRVDGIGPKKAAMVARDAIAYDHEMTIPKILGKMLNKEIGVERGHHTLVFIDVHARRVFKNLGLLDGKGANAILTPQYVAAMACPENPGAVDLTIWYLGREICKFPEPLCGKCPLNKICYYYNIELMKQEHDVNT